MKKPRAFVPPLAWDIAVRSVLSAAVCVVILWGLAALMWGGER
jgi:hypothetical protein